MTILDFTTARPVGLARADVVDARYRLVESLADDDTARGPMVWRAFDAVLGRHVILDVVPTTGGEVCLDTLLPELGLELAAVLDAGEVQLEDVSFVYLASELPALSISAHVA